MELLLFDAVAEACRTMVPSDLGELRIRSHRYGTKVWFDTERPGREHYEAQVVGAKYVEGAAVLAVEVGFHAEHPKLVDNELAVGKLTRSERTWRRVLGDDVVIGRGSLVENDTTIGAMTKIQADAYITAYSTLEEHVFIAPCVVTTNDNFMGRTERRPGLVKGPTIRRGARIGGGAILLPGVEVGEEAFVGAGAVVTKDVDPRVVVVGNPARVLKPVPEDELLENQ